ncbi:MAG: GAF domain-containing protein [Spirulinaceae cyanobacterium RM2_2_10]|nr:GAF domain-containing protein [Spirulinaceae cyanobacterium RM2_2_10]
MVVSVSDMRLLDGLADAFFTLDPAWCFVALNQAAEEFWGQSRQQLLGRCIWDSFPHLRDSYFEQSLRQGGQQRVPSCFEIYLSPVRNWYEVQLMPGNDVLAICLRDISTRRQLEIALRDRAQLAQLEAQISRTLAQKSAATEGLHQSSQLLCRGLGAIATAIWLYDAQNDQLELQTSTLTPALATAAAIANLVPRLDLLTVPVLRPDEPLLAQAVQQHQANCQPLAIANNSPLTAALTAATQFCQALELPQLEVAGVWFATYPLLLEERLLGILGVWLATPLATPVDELLATVAYTLAIAIDRAWARAALLSRREALLFRLANQIRNSLDLNTILGTAVREIRTLLQVDWCGYLWCWFQNDQHCLTVSHQAGDMALTALDLGQYSSTQLRPLIESIVNQQLLRCDDLAVARQASDHQPLSAWSALLQELDIQALLVLPLKTRSEQLGAIFCAHRGHAYRWHERDLELLQAVVDQLALAIDQAELFAKTNATALAAQTQTQQLQRALEELKQTQSQLIQTEKMSSLGQMIAGIAHEINNPVNFISGNLSYTGEYIEGVLQLLRLYQKGNPKPSPEIAALTAEIDLDFILEDLPKTLASMQIGAERIRQIVISLRNFSRLNQAGMKPVDIHEGLDSTLLILHNRLKAKAGQAEVQVYKNYGDLPLVECYAGQLNQVFMNIIGNAADALENTPEPHAINITTAFIPTVATPADTLPSGTAQIRIRDNGSGMDSTTLSHIFDPFFTTKPVGKGTGLGLSISYQIVVEKHHGCLECHSQPGEGTEFIISIPTVLQSA